MSQEMVSVQDFLRTELLLSSSAINIAFRQWRREQGPLPTILWRYGLITLDQLTQVFDWLDKQGKGREG